MIRTLSAAIIAAAIGSAAMAAEPVLPKSMVWTAYDLGSTGYAEATAISIAFKKRYGTRVRIIPAGTSIGRILPLVTGKARYGYLANGAFFAAEGTYDFATQQWGPQDIRVIAGRVASVGVAVAGDAGVKTIADLKGKRLGFVKGNPSVNVKNEAYLAFGGLTLDDIQQVWFGSYNAMKTAIIANQLDAMGSATASANMREIEASPRGIAWPEFRPENKEGWDKMQSILSFTAPYHETKGAGISDANPKWLVGFRYPVITVYPKHVGADEAYNYIRALDESFDDYKNVNALGVNWAIEGAGPPPYDAPAHEGTIRYLKEKGYWKPEHQEWQDKRLARLNKVLAAWDDAQAGFLEWREAEKAKGSTVDADEAWATYWADYRKEHL
ncbi:MAG: TAXI family TRAP transporter solute-binding subunit [Alphaproteobacteria bacterium]|nr:TAXI family TRAP transporter solute-binding subunit [Alphaproteobacteria bacterium]MCB9930751.1 TAXI family TRAP transporter solute-binding subunit [Alphaproteobacteria bacterium]